MESVGFDPNVDDCGRDGEGVSGWSFEINEDWEEIVVRGGEDDDDAVAGRDEPDTLDDWFVLLRFRGWY
jgi:hypothetical protein